MYYILNSISASTLLVYIYIPLSILKRPILIGWLCALDAVRNVPVVFFHAHRKLALRLGFLGVLDFLSNSSQSKSYCHTSEGHDRHSMGECKVLSDDDEPLANPF